MSEHVCMFYMTTAIAPISSQIIHDTFFVFQAIKKIVAAQGYVVLGLNKRSSKLKNLMNKTVNMSAKERNKKLSKIMAIAHHLLSIEMLSLDQRSNLSFLGIYNNLTKRGRKRHYK